MRVKTQFMATVALFGIMLAIISASAVNTTRQVEEATRQVRIANRIAQGANDLGYLSTDYLVYREAPQVRRWQSRFASFSDDVAALHVDQPEQQVLVRSIEAGQHRMKDVFESVVSGVGSSPGRAPDLAFLQMSWSRMAVHSQGLVSDASRLSEMLRNQADQARQANMIVTLSMIGVFGAYFLVNYLIVQRRLLQSIAELRAGTRVLGSGNLGFIIKERRQDEIGELSRAFNQMATNLQQVMASKADLEREITERERVEEALRQSEARFRTVIENSRDGINMLDLATGRYVFMSPAQVAMTGFTAEELYDLPAEKAYERVHPDDRELSIAQQQQVAAGQETAVAVKYRWKVKSGGYRWFSDSRGLVRDPKGRPIALVGVSRDITERKEAEEALARAREQTDLDRRRLATILETVPSAIAVVEASDGQISYLNRRAIDLYAFDYVGYDLGTHVARVNALRADGTPYLLEDMPVSRSLKHGQEVRNEEMTFEGADGRRWPVLVSSAPLLDAEGRITAAIVVFEDITDRKRAEAERERLLVSEREARRQAEEAVRARDEFLSIAAHELKTPVTSIRGFAQVILRQYEKRGAVEPEHVSRALKVIDQQSNKLTKLVIQLLDLSRLEGGRLALERQHVDLVRLVEEVAAAARLQVTNHTLKVEALSRAEAFVDPVRIEQVITNLVDNAIRYSPKGGPIEIKVTAGDGAVEIAVRDRGIGIPPEHSPYLFNRFYRAHEGETIAGLGLGLYVSKEIIDLHGGRITMECPPDGGTCFVVSLPVDNGNSDEHHQGKG